MLTADLYKHRLEFARALDRHQYEVTDKGIYFPKQKVVVAGIMDHWLNGTDHQVDPNIVPTEGLNYLLQAGVNNSGGLGSWYIAPYSANVAPGATLTAANFTSTQTEWTEYNESTRQQWVVPGSPTGGSFDNSASLAVFTGANTIATYDSVYGAAILSASAKSATSGKILACVAFTSGARQVHATDLLSIQYTLAATST